MPPAHPVLPSGEQFELRHGDQVAVAVEVGGGLRTYTVGDWEVLDGYAAEEMCSAGRGQLLMPWPNRLRDGSYRFAGAEHQLPLTEPPRHNAIHGLVRWRNWGLVRREPSCVVLEHRLHPMSGYPFALHLEVAYTLSDDGLTVHTVATNVGARPCPYGAGAHPYVRVGEPRIDTAVLIAPAARRLTTDDRAIPTGSAPVDGSPFDFRSPRPLGDIRLDTACADLSRDADGKARVVLGTADGRRAVTVWMDESHPYLMLFTGDSIGDPARRRRGLAVEPMTCAPNAFESGDGLRILEPGESHTAVWGISPRRDDP